MKITRKGEEFEVAPGHEWFWPGFADGSWEPDTFDIFDRFLKPDSTMLDIGAWIGPTVMYAARRCKEVFAFEPDVVAIPSLVHNIVHNDLKNVTAYSAAVTDQWGRMPFGPRGQYGDSMSSVLWAKTGEVSTVPFATLIRDLQPDFIKIDIEGGEMRIFEGAREVIEDLKPTVHLSLHTPYFVPQKYDAEYREKITEALSVFPYLYNEKMQPITVSEVFTDHFNSIVATFHEQT